MAGALVGDPVVSAHLLLVVVHLGTGHPGAGGLLGSAQGEVHGRDALVTGQGEATMTEAFGI